MFVCVCVVICVYTNIYIYIHKLGLGIDYLVSILAHLELRDRGDNHRAEKPAQCL